MNGSLRLSLFFIYLLTAMTIPKTIGTLLLAASLIASGCALQWNNETTIQDRTANPYSDDYSLKTAISQRDSWGVANVHDPSVIQVDDTYYVFSTDAIYNPWDKNSDGDTISTGYIQIRSSKDLINWKFEKWAFTAIPQDAVNHVLKYANNKGAEGIWAPHICKSGSTYRLYYSVSCFGTNASYIGLATASSPLGPWQQQGSVVTTTPQSLMNALDPAMITDAETGKQFLCYGSYFDGIYIVELNPQTGLALTPNDNGKRIAARAKQHQRIIEAPEIIYQPEFKLYYLFVSYDPLFTHYNVRVGRSKSPTGPFLDFFGNDMADTTNNYPVLTQSYMFNNHPGWSGNGHSSILHTNNHYFMLHHSRLAPDNLMMELHVRQLFWLSSGWPVVSPERFADTPQQEITHSEIEGKWEIITLNDIPDYSKLWQGQTPPGGWSYATREFNTSQIIDFKSDGTTNHQSFKTWELTHQRLMLESTECVVTNGWDWENQKETILFTGILKNGFSIWGKKVN